MSSNPSPDQIEANYTDLDDHDKAVGSTVERLAVGAMVSLVGKGVGRGIDFAKQVALARLLSVEAYGLFAIIWNLLKIIGIFAPLGLQNGVIKFASEHHQTDGGKFKDIVSRSIGLCLVISVGFSTFLWVIAPWLGSNVYTEPGFVSTFRIFVLVLPPLVGLRVVSSATRISQRMQYAIYAEELFQSISALLLFVLFFMWGWKLMGAVWATVISFFLAFALSIFYLYRLFPFFVHTRRISATTNISLLSYSLPTAFSGMFSVVVTRLDRLFLGYYQTAADVGIYQAASQLSIVFAIVLDGFNAIFSPIIADLYHKNQFTKLQEIFCISTKWGIYVNVPILLVVFFVPHSLMEGVFGTPYLLGVTSLLILTIGQVVNISVGGVGRLLIMTGNQNTWLNTTAIAMILSIVLNVLLIPKWGIMGAAIATSVSVSLLFIVGLFQVRFLLHLWPYDARYKKGILATAITIIGLLIMRIFSPTEPLIDLVITAFLSCGLFFGTLLIIGLDEEDKTFFRFLKNRLTEKK
jgi:O-antigen/teichoic acid export membrane protein